MVEFMINHLTNELEKEKAQLKIYQTHFSIMTDNEIHLTNYERNAISQLQTMQESKIKIAQLESHLSLIKNCN